MALSDGAEVAGYTGPQEVRGSPAHGRARVCRAAAPGPASPGYTTVICALGSRPMVSGNQNKRSD